MTANAGPAAPPQDLSGIIGYRIRYVYDNGWRYEVYVKNATTIDYHVHSGDVGGRIVKGQSVDVAQLDDGHYKLSWTEPTRHLGRGQLPARSTRVHGSTYFPRWIANDGSAIAVYQNDHLEQMHALRDGRPHLPDRGDRRVRDHHRL